MEKIDSFSPAKFIIAVFSVTFVIGAAIGLLRKMQS